MKRLIVAGVTLLIVSSAALFSAVTAFDPGPIPTCNGEQATHVMVAETADASPEAHDVAIAPFQEWIDQGVSVQANEDAVLRGTVGHDVLVALVPTTHGGFTGKPNVRLPLPAPTDGDFMCSFLKASDDVYYATRMADTIFDSGGNDLYFAGGCKLEGTGSPGNRACDLITSTGDTNANVNKTWGLSVPAGRIQQFIQSNGMDHTYAGLGAGKVIVSAGGAPTTAPGGGDHVHPCPVNQFAPTDLRPSGEFSGGGFILSGVEYLGPEAAFTNDPNDPCTFQQRSL